MQYIYKYTYDMYPRLISLPKGKIFMTKFFMTLRYTHFAAYVLCVHFTFGSKGMSDCVEVFEI